MDIKLFDTTLRDGTQSEDISFTVEDKLHIAHLLDEFGIHYIEGGWPGSNPKDIEFFQRIAKKPLKHAKMTAFGSTRRAKLTCEQDSSIQALIQCEAEVACIFGKTWDFHVTDALQISLEENLEIIENSIDYLKSYVSEVVYDAEHFFDGYKANPSYALQTIKAAVNGGASYITLCDTNGGSMPWEIQNIIQKIQQKISTPLGIHAHNDCEVAVANTLIAIKQGVQMLHGTINGFGERCGNANLISIIPGAQIKLGIPVLEEENLKRLTHLSHSIRELANVNEWKNQPYTGKSAFAHKGGVHVSAILKNPETYEHITPDIVGNQRRVLISDLSGKSNLTYKIKEMGLDIDSKDPKLIEVVNQIKDMENKGYTYEAADASLELLLNKAKGNYKDYFTLCGYRVIDERRQQDLTPINEATILIKNSKGETSHTASLGQGPVDALNMALIKALIPFYPILKEIQLIDYKVRILNEKAGTKAMIRVLTQFTDKQKSWTTVGVDQDIIRASYLALVDSIRYKLYKEQL